MEVWLHEILQNVRTAPRSTAKVMHIHGWRVETRPLNQEHLLYTQATHEAPVTAFPAHRTCTLGNHSEAETATLSLCRSGRVVQCAFFFLARLVPSRRESVPGLRVSMELFLVTRVECGLLIDLFGFSPVWESESVA